MKEELIQQAYNNLQERILKRSLENEIIGDPEKKDLENKYLPGYYYDYENLIKDNKASNILKGLDESQDLSNRDKRYDRLMKASDHPEIDGALKIHADEATTKNIKGEIYNVYHDNIEIKKRVLNLFDRIGLQDIAWQSIYNFCLLGDEFREIIFSLDGKKIMNINYIPPKLISRIERNSVLQWFEPREPTSNYADLNNFGGSYYWDYTKTVKDKDKEQIRIEPFRILHSRIPSFKYSPYGESVIDKQVAVIEKLNLMEQGLLIARLTRSPERRLYNIAVGNLHGEKAIQEALRVTERLKRKKILDFFNGGKVDKTVDFWGNVEDIIIPRRAGEEPSTVDTLPGINNTSENGDIEFIRDRLFPGFVPRQYIYDDSFANANQALSNKNIPFAKKIRRIQQFHLQQIYKLAVIELSLAGFSKEEISSLSITMNNPSNLDEKERLEVQNTVWGLVSSIKGTNSDETPFFPDYLIYKDILNLSNEEILLIQKLNLFQKDKKNSFYVLPKEERPFGYEELDNLLNPEAPEDLDSGEDESGMDDLGDGGDEETYSDDQIPGEVADALSDVGGERGDLDLSSNSENIKKKQIYLESVKRKAMNVKKKALKKFEKQLREKQLILESEELETIDFDKVLSRLSNRIKDLNETKLTSSIEYLEGRGEFGDLNFLKLKEYLEKQE